MANSPDPFCEVHARVIERLHARAQAARWHLSLGRFAAALQRSADHRFRGRNPSDEEVATYLETLEVEDLALACACADGVEAAWDHFVAHFRPILYGAARAIAGESAARELADSLYAELFGLGQRDGRRRPLFEYFHGRSKLSTWLRAVLSRRYVDTVRVARRTEPIDETAHGAGASVAAPVIDPERGRYLALLRAAIEEALAAIEPRDRLRLACYYVEELTLAQIGRLIGEHEATSSRKLDRTRRELRQRVERTLGSASRLNEAQIRLCYEYALEEWPFDLTRALSRQE